MSSSGGSRPTRLSVRLSARQRQGLAAQAKKRKVTPATAARILCDEHLSELEDRAELSAAEEWQRAQAWATWEKIKAGDVPEATLGELHAMVAKARRAASARPRSR